MTETAVKYDVDADGIVTLTLDDPNSSANTMNDLYKESMKAAIDRLYAEKDQITGDHLCEEDLLRRWQPQEHARRLA